MSVRIEVHSPTLGNVEIARDRMATNDPDNERRYIERALNEALATIRRAYNIDTKENS